jgi:hypothetical protein
VILTLFPSCSRSHEIPSPPHAGERVRVRGIG